jgi:hypothetical protein
LARSVIATYSSTLFDPLFQALAAQAVHLTEEAQVFARAQCRVQSQVLRHNTDQVLYFFNVSHCIACPGCGWSRCRAGTNPVSMADKRAFACAVWTQQPKHFPFFN